jgi:hypothetical protein
MIAEVLHCACKVPPAFETADEHTDLDAEALKWVSALQIESKFYHAQSGTESTRFTS